MSELLQQVHVEFGVQLGETDMFMMDNLPATVPMISVVEKGDIKTMNSQKERIMGVCSVVQYRAVDGDVEPGEGGSVPNYWARQYFGRYEKRETSLPPLNSVEIIKHPKYGKVVLGKDSGRNEILQYIPNVGYVGKDRIDYRVLVDGIPVKLIYFVNVTKKNLDQDEYSITEFCKDNTWKISLANPASKVQ